MSTLFASKWRLAVRVLPLVLCVVLLKLAAHEAGFEFLSLSPLVGSIISANVFLLGFLISGVMTDYKESERLPGDLACALESLTDEAEIIALTKKSPRAAAYIGYVYGIAEDVLGWLHKRVRTADLMQKISGLNPHFAAFEDLTQATAITRLKQEQANVRKIITRIHTLREMGFNPSGYAIAEIMTTLLCVGLVLMKIDPYYEGLFFVGFVSYVLIYMVLLIKGLDNPFSHYEEDIWIENVSLKPLRDLEERLKKEIAAETSSAPR